MKRKVIAILLMFVILIALVGCSNEEAGELKTIVIASKPMTEQYIIVEMLTYLIEKNSDITVEQKMGIGGGTSNIHPAMLKGEIDMYPEYTGTGWLFVLKKDLMNDPQELYNAVKTSYEEEFNIIWSELYGFNDTFGIAIKESLALDQNIKTYSDLAEASSGLRIGAEYDFYEREDGFPGLESTYGFDFKDKVELDIGLKYQAIGTDEVEVINVFSTDGRLKEQNLVVLEDDKNFFPSYFAATLVRKEVLEQYPELKEIIGMLDNQISSDEMTQMNYLVEIEKRDPEAVAKQFLEKKGLY